jgi:hypothetical protein
MMWIEDIAIDAIYWFVSLHQPFLHQQNHNFFLLFGLFDFIISTPKVKSLQKFVKENSVVDVPCKDEKLKKLKKVYKDLSNYKSWKSSCT